MLVAVTASCGNEFRKLIALHHLLSVGNPRLSNFIRWTSSSSVMVYILGVEGAPSFTRIGLKRNASTWVAPHSSRLINERGTLSGCPGASH